MLNQKDKFYEYLRDLDKKPVKLNKKFASTIRAFWFNLNNLIPNLELPICYPSEDKELFNFVWNTGIKIIDITLYKTESVELYYSNSKTKDSMLLERYPKSTQLIDNLYIKIFNHYKEN